MFQTRITDLLGIQHPIVQGGLQWLATSDLAAAVSEAGGLGTISSLSFPDRETLRREIQRMKSLTQKPFALNLSMLPELSRGDRTQEILDIILEEKVPVVETSKRLVPARLKRISFPSRLAPCTPSLATSGFPLASIVCRMPNETSTTKSMTERRAHPWRVFPTILPKV